MQKREIIRKAAGDCRDLHAFLDLPETAEIITACADLLAETVNNGRPVLLCGNGGSAADCQHWAGEMIGRFKKERRAAPFIALTTDTSIMTSIANDYDFDRVFSRQVEGLGVSGGVLVCISTSGKSPGILAAAATARARGMKVIGLSGATPNPLAAHADLLFAVPSGDTPRIQECHIFFIHTVCELVETTLS